MRRPGSLPHAVMIEIQQVFVREGLKVGDRLPSERELAKQLSVGRSSLREAVQGLQTLGFLERRHGVGTFFIAEPGSWSIAPLKFQPRSPVRAFRGTDRSPFARRGSARGARRGTRHRRGLPEAAVRRPRSARALAPANTPQLGLEFHLAIAAAAHHAVLLEMLKAVASLYWETLNSLDIAPQDVVAAFRARQHGGHDRILGAIIARDPDAAADCDAESSARVAERLYVDPCAVADGALMERVTR